MRTKLGGRPVTECAISTSDGVKAADIGWFSDVRYARAIDAHCFTAAPEICVEVLSPSNTPVEMNEKMALYSGAGADEVWFCEMDAALRFHSPGGPLGHSQLCQDFPAAIVD